MSQAATLDFNVQKLVQAGFDRKQAEVLLRTIDQKMKSYLAEQLDEALAKQSEQIGQEMAAGFKEFRMEIQSEIKDVHHALSSDVSTLRVEMTTETASIKTMLAEKVNSIFLQTAGLITLAVAVLSAVIAFVGI